MRLLSCIVVLFLGFIERFIYLRGKVGEKKRVTKRQRSSIHSLFLAGVEGGGEARHRPEPACNSIQISQMGVLTQD